MTPRNNSFIVNVLVRVLLEGRIQRGVWISAVVHVLFCHDFLIAITIILFLNAHKWFITSFLLRKLSKPKIGEIVYYLYISQYGDQCGLSHSSPKETIRYYHIEPIRPNVNYLIRVKIIDIKEDDLFELELLNRRKMFEYERVWKFWNFTISSTYGYLLRGGGNGNIFAARSEILVPDL